MEGVHRITITPDGWVLWQDNRKLKLAEDGTVPLDGYLVSEIGLERYQHLDGFDWKPGVDLWDQEKAEWAVVRETWHEMLSTDNVHLTGEETIGVALLEAVGGEDPLAGMKAVRDAVVKP